MSAISEKMCDLLCSRTWHTSEGQMRAEFYHARVGEIRATSCVPYLKKGGCTASLDKELRLSSE
jgi:hypothetical protein